MTQRSGTSRFSAATARCTMPSGASAPDPRASLPAGMPKRITPRHADVAHIPLALVHQLVHRVSEHTGHRRDRLAHGTPLDHEERQHQIVGHEVGLTRHRAQSGRAAQAPHASYGKAGLAHHSSLSADRGRSETTRQAIAHAVCQRGDQLSRAGPLSHRAGVDPLLAQSVRGRLANGSDQNRPPCAHAGARLGVEQRREVRHLPTDSKR